MSTNGKNGKAYPPMLISIEAPGFINTETADRLKKTLSDAVAGSPLEGVPIIVMGDALSVKLITLPPNYVQRSE